MMLPHFAVATTVAFLTSSTLAVSIIRPQDTKVISRDVKDAPWVSVDDLSTRATHDWIDKLDDKDGTPFPKDDGAVSPLSSLGDFRRYPSYQTLIKTFDIGCMPL